MISAMVPDVSSSLYFDVVVIDCFMLHIRFGEATIVSMVFSITLQ